MPPAASDAVVRGEELEPRRQHDRDRLPRLETLALQARRDGVHLADQAGIGEARLSVLALEVRDVQAVGMRAHVPVEHL